MEGFFEDFLDLDFLELIQSLMDSKVCVWEILKAAHHLILNSPVKCWGKGGGRKLWVEKSQ